MTCEAAAARGSEERPGAGGPPSEGVRLGPPPRALGGLPNPSLPSPGGGVGDQDARPGARGPAPPSPAPSSDGSVSPQRPDGGAGGAGGEGCLMDPLELKQLRAWLRGGGRRT